MNFFMCYAKKLLINGEKAGRRNLLAPEQWVCMTERGLGWSAATGSRGREVSEDRRVLEEGECVWSSLY